MGGKKQTNQASSTQINFELQREGECNFSFNDLESLINKFFGNGSTNIKKWLQDFDLYAETFQWNSLQKFVFCKKSLIGAAKLFIDHEAKPMNYRDLYTSLINEFLPRTNSAEIHKKLQERKKLPEESLQEYLYCMIDLASQADIEDAAVITYVIEGIKDSPINKMCLYEAKTLQDFKEKLKLYEKVKSAMSLNKNNESIRRHEKDKRNNVHSTQKRRHCFNCGSNQHEFHECPEKSKGPKCFKCNNYGHKRADCRYTGQQTNSNVLRKSEMFKKISVNNIVLDGLIDTGSDITVVKESQLKNIGWNNWIRDHQITVSGIGTKITTKGTILGNIVIDGVEFGNVTIHVVSSEVMQPDIIIGMDLLSQVDVIINEKGVSIKERHNGNYSETLEPHNVCSYFLSNIQINETEERHALPDLHHIADKTVARKVYELITSYEPERKVGSPNR